ncbi:MAG: hypothetical protein JSW48_09620 [Betaproteobacteria bacterium]|jgi:hypothetical protein|nr:MAG: hypothetical protein JSW48_09620 [Betaproteobacteria bacterium]
MKILWIYLPLDIKRVTASANVMFVFDCAEERAGFSKPIAELCHRVPKDQSRAAFNAPMG